MNIVLNLFYVEIGECKINRTATTVWLYNIFGGLKRYKS